MIARVRGGVGRELLETPRAAGLVVPGNSGCAKEDGRMLIGKPGPATTSLCTADAAKIDIRGRDLCRDLMGRIGFTEFLFLLVTGRMPSADQGYFLDLLLLSIAEHGLTPTAQAARMTYDADPGSLQRAAAAGTLGCGTVVLDTSELCDALLADARRRSGP
jgi:citrate synthase